MGLQTGHRDYYRYRERGHLRAAAIHEILNVIS